MSTARAQANHKLYLAKIQLSAWRRALASQEIAASILSQAFFPALREHLMDSYGWFLLAVSGVGQLPERPPHRCEELPEIAPGKSVSGEIREFQQLQRKGWLADLLADPHAQPVAGRTPGNLAAPALAPGGPEQAGQWIDQLEALFDRMGDSLDEY